MFHILTSNVKQIPQFGVGEDVALKIVLAEDDHRQAAYYVLLPQRIANDTHSVMALRRRIVEEADSPLAFPIAAAVFPGLDSDSYVHGGLAIPMPTESNVLVLRPKPSEDETHFHVSQLFFTPQLELRRRAVLMGALAIERGSFIFRIAAVTADALFEGHLFPALKENVMHHGYPLPFEMARHLLPQFTKAEYAS